MLKTKTNPTTPDHCRQYSTATQEIQVSVSYFGSVVARYNVDVRSSLTEIFSYIKSRLTDIVGMVSVTLRDLSKGVMSCHRIRLGSTAAGHTPVPSQLTLF